MFGKSWEAVPEDEKTNGNREPKPQMTVYQCRKGWPHAQLGNDRPMRDSGVPSNCPQKYLRHLHWCRYPVRVQETVTDDPKSVQEHNKALHEEMKKANPRDHLLLPLMKSTFDDRRVFVQNDAASVTEILDSYPALAQFSVVRLCMPCQIY